MDSHCHQSFVVTDRSYGAAIKREVRLLAGTLKFSDKKKGELDIIVSELLSNLVKYAREGELLVRPGNIAGTGSIELISVDSGPGMADPRQMMTDGVSTGGSLGQGLGAIQRLANEFELYSHPDHGTVVLVRVHQKAIPAPKRSPLAEVRWIIVPKPGETVCGDACYTTLTTSSLLLFLGDGLGHGQFAQVAVEKAIQTLEQVPVDSPATLLGAIHEATTGTRGLVGTCAVFDFATRKWSLCGVGNIVTKIRGVTGVKNYLPHNGILGHSVPRVLLDVDMPYARGQVVIMTSDGLQSRWNPARYPGIGGYDLSILAALIYKECARRTDDMSVLVSKLY